MAVEDQIGGQGRLRGFDFHGPALDGIWADYRAMHASCPVGHSSKYGGFTFIAKLEDIFAAEQDPETFAVAPSMLLPAFGTDVPMIPIDIDPPMHGHYRKILLPLFTPRMLDHFTPGIRQTSRELAQAIAAHDVADASKRVRPRRGHDRLLRLCGFPEEDWPKFDQWVDDIIYERTADPDRAYAAGNAVRAYFDDLADRAPRHAAPGRPDQRAAGRADRGRTPAHARRAHLVLLPPVRGRARHHRLGDPGRSLVPRPHARGAGAAARAAGADPRGRRGVLRMLSPVQAMARTCKRDTVVRGTEIKAGERVVLALRRRKP